MTPTLPARFVDAFDALHERAASQTGLSDFGPRTDYEEGLRQVLQAYDTDLAHRFTPRGRELAADYLTSILVSRLYTEAGWKRHPQYRDVRITRPLVIIGIPRTGTTVLHKLLSVDPQFQGIEQWLFNTPMPRPAPHELHDIAEYQACVAGLREYYAAIPGMRDRHEMVANEVDECLSGLVQNFNDNKLNCVFALPTYETWWWRRSQHADYRRYADMMRLIGLNDSRRWLLKNPHHLFHMDGLFEAFPDACVIHTHRDPAKALPSLASLLVSAQRLYLGDHALPCYTGITEAQKWLHGIYRTEQVRRQRPEQFHDVLHEDFYADPIGVVRGIYRRFDLHLAPETEAAMRAWLANQNPEQKPGQRYTATDFGVTEKGLRELYAGYIETFRIPT